MASAASTLASAPIGQLIRDMAMAIADAQSYLDAAAIETTKKMADPVGLELGGGKDKESFSLLALGFAPTFYSFIEADIELVLETRISEDTTIGANVGATLDQEGGKPGATPDAEPGTRAVGMTMSAEFQRKFAVETSGHTRITAKLVALPPPARFLEAIQASE